MVCVIPSTRGGNDCQDAAWMPSLARESTTCYGEKRKMITCPSKKQCPRSSQKQFACMVKMRQHHNRRQPAIYVSMTRTRCNLPQLVFALCLSRLVATWLGRVISFSPHFGRVSWCHFSSCSFLRWPWVGTSHQHKTIGVHEVLLLQCRCIGGKMLIQWEFFWASPVSCFKSAETKSMYYPVTIGLSVTVQKPMHDLYTIMNSQSAIITTQ